MTGTRKTGKWPCVVSLALSSTITVPAVDALEYQLSPHEFSAGLKPRVAFVSGEQSGRSASVLFRASAESKWTKAFTSFVELDYVATAWEDEFSNGERLNGKPAIPDVEGFDLNQLHLRYQVSNAISVNGGREVINLGNERFVGSNGFWQNEQSLDTAGLDFDFGTASSIRYAYVANANRITGSDAGKRLSRSDVNFEANNGIRPPQFLGDHEHDTHLVFAQWKEADNYRVHAYYFNMDIIDAEALSNEVAGGRFEYKGRAGRFKVFAHAEAAIQRRTEIASGKYIPYYSIGGGLGLGSSDLSVSVESLGENDGIAFVTPLASLHDFNGWSDQFLLTPAEGLNDYAIQYVGRFSPFKLDLRFHWFFDEDTSLDYGREFDLDLSVKFDRKNTVLLRCADFHAKDRRFESERRVFLTYFYNL